MLKEFWKGGSSMAKVGNLLFIKVSPLFIGVALVTFIVLGIVIYMKKRNGR